MQEGVFVRAQLKAHGWRTLVRRAYHHTFAFLTQECSRYFQVQQFIGTWGVQQQMHPFVLADGQARQRNIEPPDVLVGVQCGEMSVVDAKHRSAEFLVSAGNGQLFIEFHNLPTIADLQRHSLNTSRILRG